ncbi:hypothetical protein FHW36_11386 [Chitinophaga polysaccharea]|uniref:Lumazine-binding protein n=1 Tax=Chitinophaga polysaccharea TaxID=1293035 RepID=A0A561P3Z2_9BACT|nr:nuclear transport factor 2 family protein [Chitinophaga polysaccharea]TWF32832.1 hypothetical protein FHW36_11386 [Chitinophaga polysaccharea]
MKHLYILLLLLPAIANAQSPTDTIKAAVNKLFTAMQQADSNAIKDCFAPGAMLQSIVTDKTGNTVLRNSTPADFATIVGKLTPHSADERIVFGSIQSDVTMATVWTPYRFYFNGQFSHCGVNSFQLVKLDGTWKIQYILDTRRKDQCVETAP